MCNELLFRPLTVGALHNFFAWYLNDILAGVLILAFSNLLLGLAHLPLLDTPKRIAPFILACAAAWELLPFVWKPGACSTGSTSPPI